MECRGVLFRCAIAAGTLSGHVTAGEVGDAGDTLTYSGPTVSTDGAIVSVNAATGSFSYNPARVAAFGTLHFGRAAAETFTYTVTANHGRMPPAGATLDVQHSYP